LSRNLVLIYMSILILHEQIERICLPNMIQMSDI